MPTTTSAIARRFLGIGGRLMIEPTGKATFAIDAAALFALSLTARRRAQVLRIGRAARGMADQRANELAALIQQHGTELPNGWIVWKGR